MTPSELPTRGALGSVSARTFLAVLASQAASGTLYLSRAGTAALLTLQRGEPRAQTDFGTADGAAFDFGATGAQFSFWPCAESSGATLPTLPSRYAGLPGPLWALPTLAEQVLLSTTETELRGLVSRLTADAFSGALVLTTPGAPDTLRAGAPGSATPVCGFLLFQKGRLGGAACAAGTQVQTGSAALRTLALADAALTLHALPEPVVAALLGLLLGLQISDASPEAGTLTGIPAGFSGLELTPAGARYYHAGRAYLQLPRPLRPTDSATLGLFAACQRVPSLSLPSEPHGWEARRYGLTLRGRDALNPMTELAMRFSAEFGRVGRRTLEGFRREPSAQVAAEALGLELDELKGLLERLEQGGFIRTISDPVSDASPTAHLQPR